MKIYRPHLRVRRRAQESRDLSPRSFEANAAAAAAAVFNFRRGHASSRSGFHRRPDRPRPGIILPRRRASARVPIDAATDATAGAGRSDFHSDAEGVIRIVLSKTRETDTRIKVTLTSVWSGQTIRTSTFWFSSESVVRNWS